MTTMRPRRERSGSAAGTAATGLVCSAVVLGAIALLVPSLPALSVLGGDGVAYDAMARHPLGAVAAFPGAARLGVPLLVSVLPGSVPHGFTAVGIVSVLLSGTVVALIAKEVGLPLAHRAAAAALVTGSYIGVLTAYNPYYVDATLLLCVSLALLFALRASWAAFLCAALLAVFVKEIGVTLVVLPYVLRRRPGRLLDPRALRDAALLAVPVVVAFALLQTAAPHLVTAAHDGRLTGVSPHQILRRGVIVSTLNPIVALFGGVALAWPLGWARSPRALRSSHVWLLVAGPVLVFGWWERTLGPFLPFVVPAALFALLVASGRRLAAFTLGSLSVTAVAGALTIGDGATSVTHKLLLVAPGLLVAAATVAPEYARVVRERRRRTAAAPA